ncbi:Ras-related protein Rab5 [Tritrichomonas foetus]|uniref:Ras-related protein Rab5 n=1 Tax=Tritrichomonas foetus TaxID=1144522 RepID=A0A1J4JM13_9EUKA|nr:Ras-related protein Rab5 [Tritrichomonas foetus]|eukprot:OHT00135.1 Ras-related protein Rab5 [Tritrichomonas foetus]
MIVAPIKAKIPRIVVLGDTSVGKTSILNRLMQGAFDENAAATTSAAFFFYQPPAEDDVQDLQIWDTAGMEQYRSLNSLYYRNASAALLVFDVTSPSSFASLDKWHTDFVSNGPLQDLVVLAGNKSDLDFAVDKDLVNLWCEKHHTKCFYTSAKSGENINDLFVYLSKIVPSLSESQEPECVILEKPSEPSKKFCC